MSQIQVFNEEINKELSVPEVARTLLATTFKGLDQGNMKKAMLEGMIRGFSVKDFLEKNVYAIPFRDGYSLITSIDYARKIGMKGGIVGKSAPLYTYKDDKKIESCTITVKKRDTTGYIGEYSATAYFDEYFKAGYAGKPSLWETKPHTMISKVAEMHALRMACPEELAQSYIEEDLQKEQIVIDTFPPDIKEEIDSIETVEALQEYYKANKGKGKEFDKYVTKRKKELEMQVA